MVYDVHCTCHWKVWIKLIIILFNQIVFKGDICNIDYNGCFDNPCISGTNCTDYTPAEQFAMNATYNCTVCPTGIHKQVFSITS